MNSELNSFKKRVFLIRGGGDSIKTERKSLEQLVNVCLSQSTHASQENPYKTDEFDAFSGSELSFSSSGSTVYSDWEARILRAKIDRDQRKNENLSLNVVYRGPVPMLPPKSPQYSDTSSENDEIPNKIFSEDNKKWDTIDKIEPNVSNINSSPLVAAMDENINSNLYSHTPIVQTQILHLAGEHEVFCEDLPLAIDVISPVRSYSSIRSSCGVTCTHDEILMQTKPSVPSAEDQMTTSLMESSNDFLNEPSDLQEVGVERSRLVKEIKNISETSNIDSDLSNRIRAMFAPVIKQRQFLAPIQIPRVLPRQSSQNSSTSDHFQNRTPLVTTSTVTQGDRQTTSSVSGSSDCGTALKLKEEQMSFPCTSSILSLSARAKEPVCSLKDILKLRSSLNVTKDSSMTSNLSNEKNHPHRNSFQSNCSNNAQETHMPHTVNNSPNQSKPETNSNNRFNQLQFQVQFPLDNSNLIPLPQAVPLDTTAADASARISRGSVLAFSKSPSRPTSASAARIAAASSLMPKTLKEGDCSQESAIDGSGCSICLDSMDATNTSLCTRSLALPCGHLFHENCVLIWLKVKQICPLCKTPTENAGGDNQDLGDLNERIMDIHVTVSPPEGPLTGGALWGITRRHS